jgi:predicted NUDIX family phosphoesterase
MTQFKKEDEIIIVIPRKKLFEDESLTFQGSTSDPALVEQIMYNMDLNYRSMRRGGTKEVDVPKSKNAELNFDFIQPIPYIVIKRGNQFYVTQRLQGGGEERLHGMLSMGAGGHMNMLEDWRSISSVIEINTMRELDEELDIKGKFTLETIGLINDDSDNVNKVNIGVQERLRSKKLNSWPDNG